MNEALPPKNRKWNYFFFALAFFALCFLFVGATLFFYSPVRHAHGTFKKIQKTVDPEAVRNWAANQATHHTSQDYLARDEIFKPLLNVEQYPPDVLVLVRLNENEPYVHVSWGGGFFHWGIFIGPTNFQLLPEPDHFHDIQWVPGIYFRHEGRR